MGEAGDGGPRVAVFQRQLREFSQTVSVCLELSTLSSPTSRTSACSSLVASSSGCSSLPSSPLQAFTLPTEVRIALCSSLDGEVTSGVDWRSLAVGLRLGRHLEYFRTRPSLRFLILYVIGRHYRIHAERLLVNAMCPLCSTIQFHGEYQGQLKSRLLEMEMVMVV